MWNKNDVYNRHSGRVHPGKRALVQNNLAGRRSGVIPKQHS